MSVPDPGMWELSVFLFWALLVFSLAFSLGCEMLVASYCCLPVPGLWALFVVCGGVVNQVFLVVGYCLFPLFLVVGLFPCFVSWFFGSLLVIISYLSKKKNVQIPTVSEFDEIRRVSYISRDNSNGEVRFVIRDLEKKIIFAEITILPFLRKLEFSGVLHPCLLLHIDYYLNSCRK